jgi:outer membrane biosynthesis protein TonB
MRPRIAGAAVIATALVAAGCGADKQSGNGAAAVTATAPAPPAATTTTRATAKPEARPQPKAKAETAATPKAKATSEPKPKAETAAEPKRKSAPKATAKRVHSVAIPAARTKVQPPRTWSGTGDKTLGTITLKRSAVVRWTIAGGGTFALENPAGTLKIGGKGKTGQSFAAAGTYKAVAVGAEGPWTLSIAQLGA